MSSRIWFFTYAVAAVTVFATPCISQSGTDSSGVSVPYPAKPVPPDSPSVPYQTKPVPDSGAPLRTKPVPPPVEVTAPFSLNASPSAATNAIEYRSEDAMTAADRDLVTTDEPALKLSLIHI